MQNVFPYLSNRWVQITDKLLYIYFLCEFCAKGIYISCTSVTLQFLKHRTYIITYSTDSTRGLHQVPKLAIINYYSI